MPRSRPVSNPISFHKATGQFYVTRCRRRVYLGTDRAVALTKFLEIEAGRATERVAAVVPITVKDLANRFINAQEANWRNPENTKRAYRDWLGRFLKDHPRLLAHDFTVEMFAAWKLSLRRRNYAPKSINHYLVAARALFSFAEDTGLIERSPKLRRVKNESMIDVRREQRSLYTKPELRSLLDASNLQLRSMILLALNCGFGPKDLEDLSWKHVPDGHVTLARSKTGVSQTFVLWPETVESLRRLLEERFVLIARLSRRGRDRSDQGYLFVTRYWRRWKKDAIAGEFRKLCKRAGVPCYGFYRLRHCASTAMSLVATPHVHRKFMRHSQLQQQVTYTHTPDAEVDTAVMRTREKLLPELSEDEGSGPRRVGAA